MYVGNGIDRNPRNTRDTLCKEIDIAAAARIMVAIVCASVVASFVPLAFPVLHAVAMCTTSIVAVHLCRLNSVTIPRKPSYLLLVHIMVTGYQIP